MKNLIILVLIGLFSCTSKSGKRDLSVNQVDIEGIKKNPSQLREDSGVYTKKLLMKDSTYVFNEEYYVETKTWVKSHRINRGELEVTLFEFNHIDTSRTFVVYDLFVLSPSHSRLLRCMNYCDSLSIDYSLNKNEFDVWQLTINSPNSNILNLLE